MTKCFFTRKTYAYPFCGFFSCLKPALRRRTFRPEREKGLVYVITLRFTTFHTIIHTSSAPWTPQTILHLKQSKRRSLTMILLPTRNNYLRKQNALLRLHELHPLPIVLGIVEFTYCLNRRLPRQGTPR